MAALTRTQIEALIRRVLPVISPTDLDELVNLLHGASTAASITAGGTRAGAPDAFDPASVAAYAARVEEVNKRIERRQALQSEIISGEQKHRDNLTDQIKIKDIQIQQEAEIINYMVRGVQSGEELTEAGKEDLKNRIKNLKELKKENKILEKRIGLLKAAEDHGKGLADNFAGLFGVSDKGFAGLLSGLIKSGDGFKGLTETAKGFGKGLTRSLLNPITLMGALTTQLIETAFRVDTLNASLFVQTGLENMGFMAADVATQFSSLTVDSEHLNSAIIGLQGSYKGFSDLTAANRENLVATTALLDGLGVSSQDTAESLGFMISSLGMLPQEAETVSRELVTLAQDMGRPPAEFMAAFATARTGLAVYGRGMVVEFKRLAAASKVLNMDVGELTGALGEQFDTFEGSATAAGKLNALLGGPFLNATELLGMTESERLVTLKQTLDAQGLSFDQMSKFQRKGIAAAMGMDAEQLGKIMNSTAGSIEEAMTAAADDDPAKAQQDLNKQIMKNLTVMEQFSRALQDIAQQVFKNAFGGESQDAMEAFKTIATDIVGVMFDLSRGIGAVIGFFRSMYDVVNESLGTVAAVVTTITAGLASMGLATYALMHPIKAVSLLWTGLTKLFSAAVTVVSGIKTGIALMMPVLTTLTAGVAAFVGGFKLGEGAVQFFYDKLEGINDFVKDWTGISLFDSPEDVKKAKEDQKAISDGTLNNLSEIWSDAGSIIKEDVGQLTDDIGAGLKNTFSTMTSAFAGPAPAKRLKEYPAQTFAARSEAGRAQPTASAVDKLSAMEESLTKLADPKTFAKEVANYSFAANDLGQMIATNIKTGSSLPPDIGESVRAKSVKLIRNQRKAPARPKKAPAPVKKTIAARPTTTSKSMTKSVFRGSDALLEAQAANAAGYQQALRAEKTIAPPKTGSSTEFWEGDVSGFAPGDPIYDAWRKGEIAKGITPDVGFSDSWFDARDKYIEVKKAKVSPPVPVQDFSALMPSMFGAKPNAADQIVGTKENGLIDKKLGKMIELLTQLVNNNNTGDTVVAINGREIARAINDTYSF